MQILGVSGSLKLGSHNHALLEMASAAAPPGARVEVFEGLRELPPFDPDADPDDIVAVTRWRDALRASDAVLFASPEYGFSLPGTLKNAIDWTIGTGELERKFVALTASANVPGRGRRGLEALRGALLAPSARIVAARPLVRGPDLAAGVAALVGAIVRAVERGDAGRPCIEAWFDFASTYSYPAVCWIEDVAMRSGIELAWRPFLLGPIFQKQGWNDSPFNLYPSKGTYMWRDLERVCARALPALPLRRPSVFPRNGLLAARVALAGEREPWCGRFVRAVFHANFAEDRDIASVEVIAALLDALGLSAGPLLARAGSPEIKAALRRQTERAEELGIFGAPTFVVGRELFWGNDRLEQAVEWAVEHPA
jgi:2-hydroxychromene-2-carboxylate isomerase/NAD(P)H-dependent FMN reductase